jgi:hypothetical protein
MTSSIRAMAGARHAIMTRQEQVHDAQHGVHEEAAMHASRLCSKQLDALHTAILLEPPASVTDLRTILLVAVNSLQDLEGSTDNADVLRLAEELITALEHVAIYPVLNPDPPSTASEARDLDLCRRHAADRAAAVREAA